MFRLVACLLVAALALLVPAAPQVQRGLFLFLLTGGLWLTEALHLTTTALLVPLLATGLGLVDAKKAFAAFADPVIMLFLGSFVLAAALRTQGLDVLLAARLVRLARGRLLPATLLLFAATMFVSMWVSNTATTAMMLPLALGLVAGVDRVRERGTILFVLLGIAWMSGIGGMGSLVGSPPNALAAATGGLGFDDWFRLGLPAMLLVAPVATLVLFLVLRPPLRGRVVEIPDEKFDWTRARISTLAIFAATVTLWVASEPLGRWLGIGVDLDAVISVGAAVLLMATGILSWKDAERGVEWGVLLLFGGGLCLGLVLKQSGTSDWLAHQALAWMEGMPRIVVLAAMAAFALALTEFMSNTAATALLLPLMMPLAPALGLPAGNMAAFIAIAASCAFMLPVATPPNAIVYGSGLVSQREMIRAGLWLDIACIPILLFLFAR